MTASVDTATHPDNQHVALIIDSPTTQDRDDALWVAQTAAGWQVRVFIADVAGAVAAGGPADAHARRQAATLYLPQGRTRPMLREVEVTLSLSADRICPVFEIVLELTPAGETVDIAVRRTVLTSGVVLTYAQAVEALADPAAPAHGVLADAAALANLLLARRRANGALALYDLLRGWATSEEGVLRALDAVDRNTGYIIVQELMIATNEALARYAAERSTPLLFRNHVASPLAPPRERLQADLDSVRPGAPFDPATVAARMHLLLAPASYDPTILGHYGLNLPVYTHATSPLRRYADLVNQRILSALIEARPTPYDREQLAAIAGELNALERARKERRAERNAEANRAVTRQVLARMDVEAAYHDLDPETFHKTLKLAIAEGRQTDGLLSETHRRLETGLLAVRDLHRLLFGASGSAWEALRQQALTWIAAHPEAAVSTLNIEREMRQWEPMTYRTVHTGSQHVPLFQATAHLVTSEGPRSGATRTGRSKKEAEQQAAVSLLALLLAAPDPSRDTAAIPDTAASPAVRPPASSTMPTVRNAVSALNEYAQQQRLPTPRYTLEQSGPDHVPTFTCTVTLALPGGARTATGQGSNKADAKVQAATQLWGELGLQASEPGR